MFAADAGARALGFLANIHLARALGAEGFGMVVIGFSFLSYALWFADLGLGTLGMRETGRGEESREFGTGEILLTRIILSLAVLLASTALAFVVYADDLQRRVVAGFLLCIIAYGVSIEWYFQGLRRYLPLLLSRVFAAALYVAALYLFVRGEGDVGLVPVYYFAAMLIPALLLFLFRRRDGALRMKGWSLSRAVEVVRRSSYIGVGGIFAQSVQLLPPLVLGYLYSVGDAGVFGAALRVASILLIIDRIFAALFLPAISRQWSMEREMATESLRRVLALVIVTGFGLGTLATIYARPVMALIFGPSYAAGGPTLAVLGWFAAVTLINSVFSFGLIGTGNERGYLRATVAGGLLSVALTVGLIHFRGISGAAAAMVASELCFVGLTYAEFHRGISIRFARPLTIALVASAAVLGCSWLLDAAELWQAPLAFLAFLGLVLLMGGIRRDDLIWLAGR